MEQIINGIKMITAILGLTTTVLNPMIEIVILFLPEIISFFSGKSKEENKRARRLIKYFQRLFLISKEK